MKFWRKRERREVEGVEGNNEGPFFLFRMEREKGEMMVNLLTTFQIFPRKIWLLTRLKELIITNPSLSKFGIKSLNKGKPILLNPSPFFSSNYLHSNKSLGKEKLRKFKSINVFG